MNSKNWNDRADKDLFFTILSVKHIGVISGAEWTIIGKHMRTLGYGFSNEGCRQHFQGLRRAQNKIEPANGTIPGSGASGAAAASANRIDPALNPITRRPGGPGRRRPRKLSSAAEDYEANGDDTCADTRLSSRVDDNTASMVAALADVKADVDADDSKVDPDGEGEIDPDAPITAATPGPLSTGNGTAADLSSDLLAAAAASGLQPLLAHTHGHAPVHPPRGIGNGSSADNVAGLAASGVNSIYMGIRFHNTTNNNNNNNKNNNTTTTSNNSSSNSSTCNINTNIFTNTYRNNITATKHYHKTCFQTTSKEPRVSTTHLHKRTLRSSSLKKSLLNSSSSSSNISKRSSFTSSMNNSFASFKTAYSNGPSCRSSQHRHRQFTEQQQQQQQQQQQHNNAELELHSLEDAAGEDEDVPGMGPVSVPGSASINASVGASVGLGVADMGTPVMGEPGIPAEHDADGEHEDDSPPDDEHDEHEAKRQKLDSDAHDSTLEDEAVLTALAAHNRAAFPTE
ncbi:hypothetical protein SPBR_03678 [Sporothrix brasiliensis 5110]|uniref:Myb-like domain-containing protein n=1 Tax=Sporothrix brasiliensis 5110 TaxID=1398154 RepID=A0A0C2FVA3_9PEZI|nr:uncharacterized protein SPBR_03678 [Sporothrix brasiliensis 5110]KIH94973.1 hypothetical protein SPBR_03678 [Sporothrix brasiliensis 5110]